ncbi:MAG: NAD(P)H-dependent oxidoreductase [Bacteroidetes bacterium]|nr:NAD(P)H-dependent oxidoreductase [Bacteroidota bacterium]
MNILENLNWRYATKRMNGEQVANEKINTILEAIRLAPSSMGLQPYKVLVVKDKAIREKIKEVSYNQPQITESAYLLVFAVWKDGYEEKTENFIQLIAKTRNQPLESLQDYKNRVLGFFSIVDKVSWASRQAYIALGFGLTTCAMLKVDSTPMEGFVNEDLDKLLELDKLGLKSVVMMAIGNRDETKDYLTALPKVRRAEKDLYIYL